MHVLDQQAATELAERHARTVLRATGMDPTAMDAGPLPYGPDDELEHLPNGAYQPYQIALTGWVDDVAVDRLGPAIDRVREGLHGAGWQVGGPDGTELTATQPADGHSVTVEALAELRRIVVLVVSPPYRHPAGEVRRSHGGQVVSRRRSR